MWGLEGFNGKKAREPLMAKSRLPNNRADGSSSPQARWYPLNTDRWSSPGADDRPLHQAWSTQPTWSPLNSTQPSTLPCWGPPDAALERMMSSAPSSHRVVCSGTPVADDVASRELQWDQPLRRRLCLHTFLSLIWRRGTEADRLVHLPDRLYNATITSVSRSSLFSPVCSVSVHIS